MILYQTFCLALLLLAGVVSPVRGQSSLAPGDIAFVSVNADQGEYGYFGFVTLVDLQQGTRIYFSDNPYINSSGGLDEREGVIAFTSPSDIQAGTVITFQGGKSDGFERFGRYDITGSADNLLAYQAGADTTFLYGIAWNGGNEGWSFSPASPESASDVPPGLKAGEKTLLSLGEGKNYRYETGMGSRGSKASLLSLLADRQNWISDDREKENQSEVPNAESFMLREKPLLGLADESVFAKEGERLAISVVLLQEAHFPVSAELTFSTAESSAGTIDIENFQQRNVTFEAGDPAGTVKRISYSLRDDQVYEGRETAVFQLSALEESAAVDGDRSRITVTLDDNDAPDLLITEVLPKPGGIDANKDGIENSREDRFIEIQNNEEQEIDLSGWEIRNGKGESHTFQRGTTVPPKGAIVIFTGGNPEGSFGGAVIRVSTLDIGEDSDMLSLVDEVGNRLATFSYGNAGEMDPEEGRSLVRKSTDEGFIMIHSPAVPESGIPVTPGLQADGTPFGDKLSMRVDGREGWRMMGTPTVNTTFEDLLGDFRMQGIANSMLPGKEPTIYHWDNEKGGSFEPPPGMTGNSGTMVPGKGYLVYFFEDNRIDEPEIQGGFPKIITTGKRENRTVSVPVVSSDANGNRIIDRMEGWNLLSNPFSNEITVHAVIEALQAVNPNVQQNVLLWEPGAGGGNGAFVAAEEDAVIKPFEAFWIRFTADEVEGTAIFNKKEMIKSLRQQSAGSMEENQWELSLRLGDGTYSDAYQVVFNDKGKVDIDNNEAFKIFSLNPNSINLYGLSGGQKLLKSVLPRNLDSSMEIPIGFAAPSPSREYMVMRWKGIEEIPEDWDIRLTDRIRNKEIDLRTVEQYEFRHAGNNSSKLSSDREPVLNINTEEHKNGEQEPRFTLSVSPPGAKSTEVTELPESVKLNPNYPNPFNPATTINYELKEEATVLLSVWNIVGQRVATLVDETKEAGEHTATWNASNMPSGIYIAQLEVNGKVFIRKMTLIK